MPPVVGEGAVVGEACREHVVLCRLAQQPRARGVRRARRSGHGRSPGTCAAPCPDAIGRLRTQASGLPGSAVADGVGQQLVHRARIGSRAGRPRRGRSRPPPSSRSRPGDDGRGPAAASTSTRAASSPRSRTRRFRTGEAGGGQRGPQGGLGPPRPAPAPRPTPARRRRSGWPGTRRPACRPAAGPSAGPRRGRRPWSSRRAPAAPSAPRSAAARMPGRKPARRSSALVPVTTSAMPSRAASGREDVDQLGLAEGAAVAGVGA